MKSKYDSHAKCICVRVCFLILNRFTVSVKWRDTQASASATNASQIFQNRHANAHARRDFHYVLFCLFFFEAGEHRLHTNMLGACVLFHHPLRSAQLWLWHIVDPKRVMMLYIFVYTEHARAFQCTHTIFAAARWSGQTVLYSTQRERALCPCTLVCALN